MSNSCYLTSLGNYANFNSFLWFKHSVFDRYNSNTISVSFYHFAFNFNWF